MYRNIYSHISDSIDDRAADIIKHIARHNKQYTELTAQILEIQDEILKYLPQDYKTLFYDYEMLWGERDAIKSFTLYKQGIIDGVAVRNLIGGNSKSACAKRFNNAKP